MTLTSEQKRLIDYALYFLMTHMDERVGKKVTDDLNMSEDDITTIVQIIQHKILLETYE